MQPNKIHQSYKTRGATSNAMQAKPPEFRAFLVLTSELIIISYHPLFCSVLFTTDMDQKTR
jgi:hypothetical protein